MVNLRRYRVFALIFIGLSPLAYAADPYADTSPADANINLCDPTNTTTGTSYSMTDATANNILIDLCASSNSGYNNASSGISATAASAKTEKQEVLNNALNGSDSSTNIYS